MKNTDKEWLRSLCEYPYSISLIGEIEPVKETALERAHRLWRMDEADEAVSERRR
jgi:hypothetical protein